jgi:putative FmdB family regulatory protein
MPTYDYLCSSCGQRVEIVHSIHGGPPEACPNCGAIGTLRKSFAPPAIVFKGTGWAKKERAAARASAKKPSDGDAGSKDAEGAKDPGAKSESAAGSSGRDGGGGEKTAAGSGSGSGAGSASSSKSSAAD